LGYDRSRDIAVLRLRGASNLQTLPIAAEGTLLQGDPVTAVGNAEGAGAAAAAWGQVVEFGQRIVARNSLDGELNRLEGLIEVDAPVRPGDSGGPLVDARGNVVGINSAGNADPDPNAVPATRPRSYAVPIAVALDVLTQVQAGFSTETVHVGSTANLGVTVRNHTEGVQAKWVTVGGPGEEVGIKVGDVITHVEGQVPDDVNDVRAVLNTKAPGDVVEVRWQDRGGTPQQAQITLVDGPPA
jgi:S1-C subfamily serine protease